MNSTPHLRSVVATLLLALPFLASTPALAGPDVDGQWSPVLDWGVQAKHMILLPTGDVLVWSTGEDCRVWDSSTDDSFTPTPFPAGDLHCAGQATLGDGRIVVIGGQGTSTHIGIQVTALFDAFTNTWTEGAEMNHPRWYGTATILADGKLLATSGDDASADRVKQPEIYDPETDTWRILDGVDRKQGLYPFMFQLPDGRIFEVGSKQQTYFLDTDGGGSWSEGPSNSFGSSGYAESCAMYRPGKFLRAGGGDPSWNDAAVIDMNVANPQFRDIDPMEFPRRRHDLTIMADGQVIAVGGTRRADDESKAILAAEIWNPDTENWTTVAAMEEARMYHSATVLLPDGRIVAGGGEAAGRLHAEVYSPPYLFKGSRPVITSSPDFVGYGNPFPVTSPDAEEIVEVALLRAAGGTHTFDQNQRYVPLSFSASGNTLTVIAPPNAATAPPGDYMLVLENTNGVPSVAEWMRVNESAELQLGAVTGRVTDDSTGDTIDGATVSFPGGTTTTDSSGDYDFSDVLPGEHTFTVSAPGFASKSDAVVVAPGQTTVADFALVAPGTVRGRVLEHLTLIPVEGVNVRYDGGATTTDSNGDYVATNVPSGEQTFTITKIGFEGTSSTVTVPPNGEVTLNFHMHIGHTAIEGEVLDAVTQEPIEGATVQFEQGSMPTNHLGFYLFDGMTSGMYTVTASAPGYSPQSLVVQVITGFEATADFQLPPYVPGLNTLEASDDAYIKEARSSNNYGDDDFLRVRNDPTNRRFRSYLKFDIATAAPVSVATLRLYVNDGSDSGGDIYVVDDNWDETSITWDNAPAISGSPIAAIGPVTAGGYVEVDVSAAFQTGTERRAGTLSLALDSEITDSAFYSSKEGPFAPQLVVDTGSPADPPVADFFASPVSGESPLTVQFLDISTGNPTARAWVLGDGTSSTEANPVHTYTEDGTYTVTLTVDNPAGFDGETKVGYIQVGAPDLVAELGMTMPVPLGESATFTGSVTAATGTALYSWDFGDGTTTAPSPDSTASHTYTAIGHFPVTMTVTDDVTSTTVIGKQTIHYPLPEGKPVSSGTLSMDEPRGLLWNVNPDNHTVSAIRVADLEKHLEVPVGREPSTLDHAPDGSVWVVNRGDATISVLDATNGALLETIDLPYGSQPFGVVVAPNGQYAYVTLEATGELARLDVGSRTLVDRLYLGEVTIVGSDQWPNPRGVAITSDSQRIFVTRFVSPQDRGEVFRVTASPFAVWEPIVLEKSPGPDTQIGGRGVPNYLVSLTISPDERHLWVPSKKDNVDRGQFRDGLALTFENTVRTITSRIDLATETELPGERMDIDNRDMAIDVEFTPWGDYAFIATQGTNKVDIIDVYTGIIIATLDEVGRAPQSLEVTADGHTLFVHSFLSRTVHAYNIAHMVHGAIGHVHPHPLDVVGVVATETLAPEVLAGKQIFYNADDRRMNLDGYISCASCHLGGGSDQRVWDFTDRGEGLRNTIALEGRAGTAHGNVHWTANFDEIQDFEHDIRAEFEGSGFMTHVAFNTGTRNQPLGDPKAGQSAALDALAAYVESLNEFRESPFRNADGTLTEDAVAGRELFVSLNCASCHSGVDFTDSRTGTLHDVGTMKPSSGQRLGGELPGIDTPTLKDVWATAPYLHDGSAATLLDVLTTANPEGKHGDVSELSAIELDQIVAYLLQIDGTEPSALPAPVIASFAPSSGTVGTPVVLTGENFTSASGVEFDGVASTVFTVQSGTEILAVVPEGAGTGRIRVVGPGGAGESATDFVVIVPPSADITLEEIVDGGSTASALVSSGAVGAADGHLYLATISAKKDVPVTGVTGLGLSWVLVDRQCGARGQTGVEIWQGIGTPSSAGPVTATLQSPPSAAVIAVARYSGAAGIGNVISKNTKGVDASCSGGTDTVSYAVDIDSADPDAVVFAAVALRQRSHEPGAGFVEQLESHAGESGGSAGVAVMDRKVVTPFRPAITIPVSGTFSKTVDWAVIALEILPAAVIDGPVIAVTPESVDFGDVFVGTNVPATFEIRNDGTQPLSVTSLSLTGTDSGIFAMDAGVTPFELDPGFARTVDVSFAPATLGAKSATVTVFSNDIARPSVAVGLAGNGVPTPTPDIAVEPASLDFGDVVVIAGDATRRASGEVDAQATRDRGDASAALRLGASGVVPNGGRPDDGRLAGPRDVVRDEPGHGDQGDRLASFIGVTATLQVRNDGNLALDVTGMSLSGDDSDDFGIVSGDAPFLLAPGASRDVVVGFAPATLGPKSALLSIVSNDPDEGQVDVPLSGNGVDTPPPPAEIGLVELVSGGVTGASTVTTGGNVTAVAGDLYLASIAAKKYAPVASVSGLGLAWEPVAVQCAGRGQTGIEIWRGVGNPTTDGPVTAQFDGSPANAVLTVAHYEGAAGVGAQVSGNTKGVGGSCSGGSDSNSYSFDLSISQGGAVAFGATAIRQRAHESGTGLAELLEIYQGSAGETAGMALQALTAESSGPVTFAGTLSKTTDWAFAGVEILPAATQVGTVRSEIASARGPEAGTPAPAAAGPSLPTALSLGRPYPNPTRHAMTIDYALPEPSRVQAVVYDTRGRRVRTLVDGISPAGHRQMRWDARDDRGRTVASGIYFVRVTAGDKTRTSKLVLLQ